MAKTRAQRKAERRKKQAQQQKKRRTDSQAQRETQVPESADVAEAELAERGANLDELRGDQEQKAATKAPAPSRAETAPSRAEVATDGERKLSRREQRRLERERKRRAKESEARRRRREEPAEKQRGRVMAFLISCWHELRRVQWPDRETLAQASAVTLIFIAIAAAYLGVLDAAFNWLVRQIV
ncbi:MAG TPA: preprotein translocase subunit SecE [Solirubrobacterales bacterium]